MRSFHNRAYGLFRRDAGRSNEGKAANPARLQGAHRDSGQSAASRKLENFFALPPLKPAAAASLSKSPGLCIRFVSNGFPADFATGQQVGGNRLHRRIVGRNFELRLLIFSFSRGLAGGHRHDRAQRRPGIRFRVRRAWTIEIVVFIIFCGRRTRILPSIVGERGKSASGMPGRSSTAPF